jgi:hypothetical protein
MSSAIASSFQESRRSISTSYTPFVRVLEIPNVMASDIGKFEWDLEGREGDVFSHLECLSEGMPNGTPKDLGLKMEVSQL